MPARHQQNEFSLPGFLFTFTRLLQWAMHNPLQTMVMLLAAQVVLTSAKRSPQLAKDLNPEVNDISDQFNNLELDLGSQDITHSFEVKDVSEAYRGRKLQNTESCEPSIEFPDIGNTWALTIGGSVSGAGTSVALCSDGSVLLTGQIGRIGANNIDVLLARFTADGVLSWAKSFGSANNEQGNSIAIYPDGRIALAGYTNSFGAGNSDILLAQFAENGTLNWAKTLGTVFDETANNLALQADGSIILTGYGHTTTFGLISNDIFLTKWAANGTLSWARIMGGSVDDRGNSLAIRPNGNIVLAGDAQSFGGALLAEFTATGGLLWARRINSVNSGAGNSLALLPDGSITLAGSIDGISTGGSALIARFAPNGNLLWAKALAVNSPHYMTGASLGLSNDGSMVLTGIAYSYGTGLGPGWRDVLLAKFAANGNLLWAKALGSADYDEGSSLAIRQDGSIVLTGYIESSRGRDVLLSQLSPDGLLPTLSTAVGYNDIGSDMLFLDISTNMTQQQIVPPLVDIKSSLLLNTYSPSFFNFNNTAITALSLVANPSVWQKPYQALPAFKFTYTIPDELFRYISSQTPISVDLQGADWLSYDSSSRKISGTPLLLSETKAQVVIIPDAVNILDGSSLYGPIVFKFCIGFNENTFIKSSAKGLAGNSLAFKPDGSMVVAGYFFSFEAANDAILAEFSANGTLSWAKAFKGNNDRANSVVVRSDGSILLTGFTDGFGAGSQDVLLAKFTSNGTLSWAKTLGGTGVDQGNSLALRPNDGIVLTGVTYGFGAGNADLLLAEFTSNGTLLWARTLGGANNEVGKSLALRSNGSIVLTGYTNSFGAGNDDALLAEFSPNGTLYWIRTIGGAADDEANSMVIRPDGGTVLIGSTESFGAGNNDILLAQFTSNGALSWARAIGGEYFDVGNNLALLADGSMLLLGANASPGAEGDILLAQFAPSGALSWARVIGGNFGDFGNSLALSADGRIAITGLANFFGTSSSEELLLTKLNADGTTNNENAYIRTINWLQVSSINPVVNATNSFKRTSLNISAQSWNNAQIDDHSVVFKTMMGYLQNSISPVQEQAFNQSYSLNLNTLLDSNAAVIRLVELNKGTLPSWLQYNRAANRISGTPSGKVRGYYYINMNLQQFGEQQEVTFIINVTNTAPYYAGNTSLTTGTGRFVFPLADEFRDQESDVISSYSISQVNGQLSPTIASIDANSGRLFGTALSGDQGAYQFNITASDPYNAIGWKILTVNVQNAAPAVNMIFTNPPPVTEGNSFSFSFERNAFFDPDGDAISYSANYPAFLNFDANARTLFGTPQSQHRGLHNFTLIATDSYGMHGNVTLFLNVNGIPNQQVALSSLATSAVGQAFSYQLPDDLFTDPDNDELSYQLVEDIQHIKPKWLGFNSSSRILSGTPTSNSHQALPIRFIVSDGRGGLSAFSVNLVTPNSMPVVRNGLANQEVAINQIKNVVIHSDAFHDADGDTLSYRVSRADYNDIPDWLSLAGNVLNFAPRSGAQGNYSINLIAYDGDGAEANTTFTVKIPNRNPVLVEALPTTLGVTVGKTFSYSFASTVFKDPDGDDLTYAIQAPGFISFNSNARALSGIPQSMDRGIQEVILLAKDLYGGLGNATLIVEVNGIPSQQFSTGDLTTTPVGMPYAYTLPVGLFSDPDNDSISYQSIEDVQHIKPSWLSFNSSSNILSGIPTANSHQVMTVLMRASDGRGGEADFTIALATPNSAPVVNDGLVDQIVYVGRVKTTIVPALAFSDADADILSYRLAPLSSISLPDWVSLAGNVLNFVPRAGAQGNHTFNLIATDGHGGEVYTRFIVHVPNQSPIQAESLPVPAVITVGNSFVYSFANTAFNDPDEDTLNYSIQAPGFLSLNANSRALSGLPQEQDRGVHEVVLFAIDPYGEKANATIRVDINGIPSRQINLNSLQTTAVGELYSFALPEGLFSDPDGDAISYNLLEDVSSKQSGLAFNSSSRTLFGTPAFNTHHALPIRFKVSDGRGGEAVYELSLSIPNSAPKVNANISEQAIFVNQVKSLVISKQQFNDADGDSLSYSLEQANARTMPDWISLAANVITFAPRAGAQGNYMMRLIANDGYGEEASMTFEVNVINRKPVQDELLSDAPIVTIGNPFTYRFASTIFKDPDGDSLTYNVQSPGFLNFNANTRTLLGTPQPADRGSYEVIFIAKDPYGAEVNTSMLININGVPAQQVNLSSITLNSVGTAFSYQLPYGLYIDPDGDELSYELSNEEVFSWLAFDPETRTLSGTPTDNSHRPVPIKFTVSDGRGAVTLYNVALTIPNSAPKEVYPIPAPPDAKATILWSFAIDADNFIDPDHDLLSYSAMQANGTGLPEWLRFNTLRRSFEGIPRGRDRGILPIKVLVSDGMGGRAESFFNATVVNSAPVAEGVVLNQQVSSKESSFSFKVPAFYDPDGDLVSYSAEVSGGATLPFWLNFSPATRTFNVLPDQALSGNYLINLVASDTLGLSRRESFNLAILPNADLDANRSEEVLKTLTPALGGTALMVILTGLLMWRKQRIRNTTRFIEHWSKHLQLKASATIVEFDSIINQVEVIAHKLMLGKPLLEIESDLSGLEQQIRSYYARPGKHMPMSTLLNLHIVEKIIKYIESHITELRRNSYDVEQTLGAARLLHNFIGLILSEHTGRGHRLSDEIKQQYFAKMNRLIKRFSVDTREDVGVLFELECAREALICTADTNTLSLLCQASASHILSPGALMVDLRQLAFDIPSSWYTTLLEIKLQISQAKIDLAVLKHIQQVAAKQHDWRFYYGISSILIDIIVNSQNLEVRDQAIKGMKTKFGIKQVGLIHLLIFKQLRLFWWRNNWVEQHAKFLLNKQKEHLRPEEARLLSAYLDTNTQIKTARKSIIATANELEQAIHEDQSSAMTQVVNPLRQVAVTTLFTQTGLDRRSTMPPIQSRRP